MVEPASYAAGARAYRAVGKEKRKLSDHCLQHIDLLMKYREVRDGRSIVFS
jgi:hypothetical protein